MTRTGAARRARPRPTTRGRAPGPAARGLALAVLGLAGLTVALQLAGALPGDPAAFVAAPDRPPDAAYWLGTDGLGRDVAIRCLHAAAPTLLAAGTAALAAVAIAAALALPSGLAGGRGERLALAAADLTAAVPPVLGLIGVALALAPAGLPAPAVAGLAIAAVAWPGPFRTLHAQARSLATAVHVRAAEAMGAGPWARARDHLLPALTPTLLACVALQLAWSVQAEAVLAFIAAGVGLPLDAAAAARTAAPSWGQALAEAPAALARGQWGEALGPTLALTALVAAADTVARWLAAPVPGQQDRDR